MYFVRVYPKRGSAYLAPHRHMVVGWKLQRDACAQAENRSMDDSVKECAVFWGSVEEGAGMTLRYRNGERV